MKTIKIDFKKYIPHITSILAFLIVSSIYFTPQLDGYRLKQSDHIQYLGMSKEIIDHRDKFDDEPLWTNSMFSGMPAYQISMANPNIINTIKNYIIKVIPRPIGYMFFLMIGFYILLLCFNVSPWVALIGALVFGLSSFNVLYLGNGHNSKIHALSFIPPIIGSFIYAYRKNFLKGSVLLSIFICLHLTANHVQMTYYMLFMLVALFIVEFLRFYKQKLLPKFIKITLFIMLAGVLGLIPTITNLWVTYEYGKETTRGKSELTTLIEKDSDNGTDKNGLDADYIKQYSMGYGEIWSLIIPNIKGGAMGYIGNRDGALDNVSPANKERVANQNSYWGEQLASGGALYYGASVFLLFLLGAFFIKDKSKWALLSVSLLAIILSMKYSSIVDFFIYYFPLFNKFRDTKMMLILVQISIPLIGFVFLNNLIKSSVDKKKFLYITFSLTGLLLAFYSLPSLFFDFFSSNDKNQFNSLLSQYKGNAGSINQIEGLMSDLEIARIAIFKADIMRSLLFILATASILYLFIIKKIKKYLLLIVIAAIVILDLWVVDKRYLNNDKDGRQYKSWVTKAKYESPLNPTNVDLEIFNLEAKNIPNLKAKVDSEYNSFKKSSKLKKSELATEYGKIQFRELNLSTNYRVFTTLSPFNNSRVSYFHKSIGGYHGAKLKKYQEVISFNISEEFNKINTALGDKPTNASVMSLLQNDIPVLNMLNTKYIIYNEASAPLVNPFHFGNVWFVNSVRPVETADDELLALKTVDKSSIIIREDLLSNIEGKINPDSTAHIQMESYLANKISYRSNSTKDQVAVFSEIYYADGWNAYIDGEKSNYFRANYLLRAMSIPAGEHLIEFKFEPETYHVSRSISIAGSILIVLFAFSLLFFDYREKKKITKTSHFGGK